MNDNILNEDRFWEIIEEVNYKSDFDHNRICLLFSSGKYGDKEDFDKIYNRYKLLENKIKYHIDEYVYNMNEEEKQIFAAFIVGLGKDDYYRSLTSQKKIEAIRDKYEITESFAYAFHAEFGNYWTHHLTLKVVSEKIVEDIMDTLRDNFNLTNRKKSEFYEDTYTFTLKEIKDTGNLPEVNISDIENKIKNEDKKVVLKSFTTV